MGLSLQLPSLPTSSLFKLNKPLILCRILLCHIPQECFWQRYGVTGLTFTKSRIYKDGRIRYILPKFYKRHWIINKHRKENHNYNLALLLLDGFSGFKYTLIISVKVKVALTEEAEHWRKTIHLFECGFCKKHTARWHLLLWSSEFTCMFYLQHCWSSGQDQHESYSRPTNMSESFMVGLRGKWSHLWVSSQRPSRGIVPLLAVCLQPNTQVAKRMHPSRRRSR